MQNKNKTSKHVKNSMCRIHKKDMSKIFAPNNLFLEVVRLSLSQTTLFLLTNPTPRPPEVVFPSWEAGKTLGGGGGERKVKVS